MGKHIVKVTQDRFDDHVRVEIHPPGRETPILLCCVNAQAFDDFHGVREAVDAMVTAFVTGVTKGKILERIDDYKTN